MGGNTISIDTKSSEPQEEDLKSPWRVSKALVGNKLRIKVDETRRILFISSFKPIYAKINNVVSGSPKNEEESNSFIEELNP